MKKQRLWILGCLMILLLALSACGKSEDTGGDASITSKWKYVESTVNGTTTKVDDGPGIVQVMIASRQPKFKCADGTNCTLRVNKNDHVGTITLDAEGVYHIDFDDTTQAMTGVITGNTLVLTNDKGNMEIVFVTK